MLTIYRVLLSLYPAAYHDEFGGEMMAVLSELQAEINGKGPLPRAFRFAREAGGLLLGAVQQHLLNIRGSRNAPAFSPRRLNMRSEFRFPKAMGTLMTLILVAVVIAIDKARAIQASVPRVNPHVGPIQPAVTLLPSFFLILVIACVAGVLGWSVLFALHRSGLHRLSEVDLSRCQGMPKAE
jgi:hypothetical protein